MSNDAMGHNPYEAPQSAASAEPQPEGFRWRLIPVALIGGFGAICLLGGVLGFVTMIVVYRTAPPESNIGAGFLLSEIANMVAAILMGLWFLFAARIGWKGRWKTAIAMSLGLYLLAVSFYVAA